METLALSKVILGPDHQETLCSMARLGLSYLEIGRVREGQALLEEAFELGQRLPGSYSIAGSLAASYANSGDDDKAVYWIDRQIESSRKVLPREGLQLAEILDESGSLLFKIESWEKAEEALQECLAIRESQTPDSWRTFHCRSMLGEVMQRQRKYQEAEPHLIIAYEGLKARSTKIPSASKASLLVAINRLIAFYEAVENVAEANRWRDEKAALAGFN